LVLRVPPSSRARAASPSSSDAPSASAEGVAPSLAASSVTSAMSEIAAAAPPPPPPMSGNDGCAPLLLRCAAADSADGALDLRDPTEWPEPPPDACDAPIFGNFSGHADGENAGGSCAEVGRAPNEDGCGRGA
jgi:hypothetical protein